MEVSLKGIVKEWCSGWIYCRMHLCVWETEWGMWWDKSKKIFFQGKWRGFPRKNNKQIWANTWMKPYTSGDGQEVFADLKIWWSSSFWSNLITLRWPLKLHNWSCWVLLWKQTLKLGDRDLIKFHHYDHHHRWKHIDDDCHKGISLDGWSTVVLRVDGWIS